MGSSTRVGHAIDGIFHLNIDQIEKIIYFPKHKNRGKDIPADI